MSGYDLINLLLYKLHYLKIRYVNQRVTFQKKLIMHFFYVDVASNWKENKEDEHMIIEISFIMFTLMQTNIHGIPL